MRLLASQTAAPSSPLLAGQLPLRPRCLHPPLLLQATAAAAPAAGVPMPRLVLRRCCKHLLDGCAGCGCSCCRR